MPTDRLCEKWCGVYHHVMEGNMVGGIIGIIFLALCIGFMSSIQPSPGQASVHPFLDPQVAAVGEVVYLNERGTYSIHGSE